MHHRDRAADDPGKGDRPNWSGTKQASVGLVATPAPFAVGGGGGRVNGRYLVFHSKPGHSGYDNIAAFNSSDPLH
jgi:hypothetical protein